MRSEETPWKHGVVMVCANERPADAPRPSCGRARGLKLRSWLKQAARAGGGPAAECRVITASCLDVCPHDGVVVSIEPGSQTVVVDPESDQDALLGWVQQNMERLAEGRRGRAKRSLLGRIRGE